MPGDRARGAGSGVALPNRDLSFAEHGGADGFRDRGAINSVPYRPLSLVPIGFPDTAALAAGLPGTRIGTICCVGADKAFRSSHRTSVSADNCLELYFVGLEAVRPSEHAVDGRNGVAELTDWLRSRRRG